MFFGGTCRGDIRFWHIFSIMAMFYSKTCQMLCVDSMSLLSFRQKTQNISPLTVFRTAMIFFPNRFFKGISEASWEFRDQRERSGDKKVMA